MNTLEMRTPATTFRSGMLVSALLVLVVLTTSCATVAPPKVVLNSVDIDGISTDGIELRLFVDVTNPNGFGADIGRLAYRVEVDDTEIANGVRTSEIHIPSGETVEVEVPFTVTWMGLGKGIEEYLDGREHLWKLSGSVQVSKGALSKTFDFSESGEFQGPDAKRVEMDF
ncbi:MAG: LEA type 2 family protein [Candidatus Eisenbacteria bacterium]